MSVYESGINGEKTVGMMHRLVHYLNKLKNLKFVIILGVRETTSIYEYMHDIHIYVPSVHTYYTNRRYINSVHRLYTYIYSHT